MAVGVGLTGGEDAHPYNMDATKNGEIPYNAFCKKFNAINLEIVAQLFKHVNYYGKSIDADSVKENRKEIEKIIDVLKQKFLKDSPIL
ncbi:MAG: hypothetical protein HYT70_03125 [Candidatus Aenigmarchaeota archaeon]|nr:hypothetical protein [Candidatus Aenigmarchaeota archaeon]